MELYLQSLISLHGVYRDLTFQLYGKQLRLENYKADTRMRDVRISNLIIGMQITSMWHHILHRSSVFQPSWLSALFPVHAGSKAHQNGVIFCSDRQLFDRGCELLLDAVQLFSVCRCYAAPQSCVLLQLRSHCC